MESLKGKKLLVLGGNALSNDIVTTAQSLGVYVIVTDWYDVDKSPAKLIADEAWNISIENYDKLTELINSKHIDGVFTNYTDSYLIPYTKICAMNNLPCLTSEKAITTISNKNQSKQLCVNHGIPVPKLYNIHNFKDIDKYADEIQFPVLTKPIDQSGQRGIFVCNDVAELKEFYDKSMAFSTSKNILIEEYLDGDYVVMFYTIQNGYVTLATMADKPVSPVLDKNQVKLPMAYILPSQYVELCKRTMLSKVQNFVTTLSIENGVIGIEAVVKDDIINVFEMQFRLGGMRHHEFVQQENNMNIMEMLVRFALTGKFEGYDTRKCDNAQFKHTYILLNVLINIGKIDKIEGMNEVYALPYVTKVTQMCHEGDEILLPATVQQICCKVSMKLDGKEDIRKCIDEVYNKIKVYDTEGKNMVVNFWKENTSFL